MPAAFAVGDAVPQTDSSSKVRLLGPERGKTIQIFVRDNNVDQALKLLKRKLQREGFYRELRRRRAYEKPSERRARKASEAVRRARKLARKRAVREGLVAAKPSKRASGR